MMMCSYMSDVETLLNYGLYEDEMQIPVPTCVFPDLREAGCRSIRRKRSR